MDILYCYGNAQTLWSVYDGIALIFGKKAFINALISISATIGLLWAFARTILNTNVGFFAKQWFLPTFLVFNLAFLPKTTVHIVDCVNGGMKYAAVDNVPLGVAAIPCLASNISRVLTDAISQYLVPANTSIRFAATGDLFGAKFMTMAKDLRLSSPRARDNIKHFVNRCFTWPYVYGNVNGLQEKAQTTDNILGFIKENPHVLCGSYWENETGETEFLSCKQGAARAKNLLQHEAPLLTRQLSAAIFGSSEPSQAQSSDGSSSVSNRALLRLIPSAWNEMLGHQKKAFDVIDQFIMINAFKEGRDDDREASNLNRLFPELVSFHGARAQAHQNMASLIKGDVAGGYMPMVQGAILSILVILFIFIAPAVFLPGGFQRFITWISLISWVSLWPPCFALIEALAAIALVGVMKVFSFVGLSIATHTAMADAAFDAYAYYKSFLLVAPVISWFIVSGSSYAITSFTNDVKASMAPDAERSAGDVVDGNVSYDNQNYGNRTSGSVSLGQQTLGPSLSYGSHLDTGGMGLTFDPTTGHVHGDHRVSQMQSNITSTDSFSASLNKELSDAQSASRETRISYEDASQGHLSKSIALANAVGTGDVALKGMSKQESLDAQRLIEQAKGTSISGGQEGLHQRSDDNSTAFKAHASASIGTPIAKVIGVDAGVGIESSWSRHESEAAIDKIAKENNWSEAERNTFTRAIQSIQSGSVEAKTERGTNLVKDHQASFENTKRLANDVSASESYVRNLTTAQQLQDRGEISVSRNLNDETLSHIAKERFGGDLAAAHQWASQNDDDFVRIGTQYAQEKQSTLFHRLKTNQDLSAEQIKGMWQEGSSHVSQKARDHGVREDVSMGNLERRLQESAPNANTNLLQEQVDASIDSAKRNLNHNHDVANDRLTQADSAVKKDMKGISQEIEKATGKKVDGRDMEHFVPKKGGAHDF